MAKSSMYALFEVVRVKKSGRIVKVNTAGVKIQVCKNNKVCKIYTKK